MPSSALMLGFHPIRLPPFTAPFAGEAKPQVGGLELGSTVSDHRPLYVTDSDLRHGTLIAGRTGVGKSKLAEWILRQLLIRRSTHPDSGSAFIFDPHWSLATDVIDFAAACKIDVPIAVIDPSAETVTGYDPIRSNPHLTPSATADLFSMWLMHAWRRSDDDAAPLMESNIKLVVRALLDARLTLAQAQPLLDVDAPAALRNGIVSRLRDPQLFQKWSRLLKATPSAFISQMGSATRAFARFSAGANVMLSQPSSLSLSQAIQEGWFIFIRTGSDTGVGSTLASIILDDLWNAILCRGEGGRPVHVLIDEFTQLCGPQVPQMLNGGRKFDLRMILLMQSATQLKHLGESGRRAFDEVRLNCLNKISFAVDVASGRSIADDIGSTASRLIRLLRGHAIVHTPSMPPGVCSEVTTKPVHAMVVTDELRQHYIATHAPSIGSKFVFDRREATANQRRLVASLADVTSSAATPDAVTESEPDEFTRIIKSVS